MAANINKISSDVDLQSPSISRAAFENLLIVGEHSAFSARAKKYVDMDQVSNDFSKSDAEYRAAERAFNMEPVNPDQILIGRRDDSANVAQVDTLTVTTGIADGATMAIDFENKRVSTVYEASNGADDDEAAQQFVDYFNTFDFPATAAKTANTGELTITSDWPGQPFDTAIVSGFGSKTTSTSNTSSGETLDTTLDAIVDEGFEFYGLATVSRQSSDVSDVAAWVENNQPVKYITRTNEADVLNNVSGNFYETLRDADNEHTTGIGHTRPWQFPDVAAAAERISRDFDRQMPTWDGVELNGVTPDGRSDLSPTQRQNLEDLNASYYVPEGGVGELTGGKTFVGEWIDVLIGVDWFERRLKENSAEIKHALVNNLQDGKIPYTDDGIAVFEEVLRKQIDSGFQNQFLATDPAPEIEVPVAADVSTTKRDSRELPPIKYEARLAGAIHFVSYEGTLFP